MTFSHRAVRGHARGFSLIELLVVIGIVVLLVAISVPAFARVRLMGMAARSLGSLRDHAAAIHVFAGDHAGDLPWPGPPVDGRVTVPVEGEPAATPVWYFSFSSHWRFLWVAEGYAVGVDDEQFLSPYSSTGLAGSYLYPCTMFSLPSFWDPLTREGPSQWRAVRLDQVKSPSFKSVMMDNSAMVYAWDTPRSSLLPYVASYADGSAEARASALPGHPTGDGAFPGTAHLSDAGRGLHTISGVLGVDRE